MCQLFPSAIYKSKLKKSIFERDLGQQQQNWFHIHKSTKRHTQNPEEKRKCGGRTEQQVNERDGHTRLENLDVLCKGPGYMCILFTAKIR